VVRGALACTYFEALGLLANLGCMLLPQLLLTAFVVFQLVAQLCLVLEAGELSPCALDGLELPQLQLPGGLMLPQQQGTLQVLLCLFLVQVLRQKGGRAQGPGQEALLVSRQEMPRTPWQRELGVGWSG
jgi:hypothetical protein